MLIYRNAAFSLPASNGERTDQAEKQGPPLTLGPKVRGGSITSNTQSGWRDLNPRPLRPERSALPSCATPRLKPRQRIAPARELAKSQCSTSPRHHQGVTEPNET